MILCIRCIFVAYIMGVDGHAISTSAIIDTFDNVNFPAMAGKPKLIYIQACRGRKFYMIQKFFIICYSVPNSKYLHIYFRIIYLFSKAKKPCKNLSFIPDPNQTRKNWNIQFSYLTKNKPNIMAKYNIVTKKNISF